MKKVYVLLVSQKNTTHLPIMQMDASLEDLFKLSADFKNSKTLIEYFNDIEIREIMIIIYALKTGEEKKRRIVGIKKDLFLDEAKDIITNMLFDLGISATFHDEESIKNLLPFRKEDREILRRIFNGK